MPLFEKLTCSQCGTVIKNGEMMRGIGVPLIYCPGCKSVLRDPSENEWDIMGNGAKFYYWFSYATALLFGPGLSLILFVILRAAGKELDTAVAVGIAVVLDVAISVIILRLHRKEVTESRRRLADPEYRKHLRRHGIAVGDR
jgi:hypothetical protein